MDHIEHCHVGGNKMIVGRDKNHTQVLKLYIARYCFQLQYVWSLFLSFDGYSLFTNCMNESMEMNINRIKHILNQSNIKHESRKSCVSCLGVIDKAI